MNEETVVAVFETAEHADAAIRDLNAVGIPDAALSRHASTETVPGYSIPGYASEGIDPERDPEPPPRTGFWARLFGGEPEHGTSVYDRRIAAGGTVVTVRTTDLHVDAVVEILDRHNPVDIDEHTTADDIVADENIGIPAMAENRVVNLGDTRVRRFAVMPATEPFDP
jgi:hypothetical protein